MRSQASAWHAQMRRRMHCQPRRPSRWCASSHKHLLTRDVGALLPGVTDALLNGLAAPRVGSMPCCCCAAASGASASPSPSRSGALVAAVCCRLTALLLRRRPSLLTIQLWAGFSSLPRRPPPASPSAAAVAEAPDRHSRREAGQGEEPLVRHTLLGPSCAAPHGRSRPACNESSTPTYPCLPRAQPWRCCALARGSLRTSCLRRGAPASCSAWSPVCSKHDIAVWVGCWGSQQRNPDDTWLLALVWLPLDWACVWTQAQAACDGVTSAARCLDTSCWCSDCASSPSMPHVDRLVAPDSGRPEPPFVLLLPLPLLLPVRMMIVGPPPTCCACCCDSRSGCCGCPTDVLDSSLQRQPCCCWPPLTPALLPASDPAASCDCMRCRCCRCSRGCLSPAKLPALSGMVELKAAALLCTTANGLLSAPHSAWLGVWSVLPASFGLLVQQLAAPAACSKRANGESSEQSGQHTCCQPVAAPSPPFAH